MSDMSEGAALNKRRPRLPLGHSSSGAQPETSAVQLQEGDHPLIICCNVCGSRPYEHDGLPAKAIFRDYYAKGVSDSEKRDAEGRRFVHSCRDHLKRRDEEIRTRERARGFAEGVTR
jgi:hypothetical protein